MKEYTLDSFVARLRELMYESFPYGEDVSRKPRDRKQHIRDVAFMNNKVTFGDNIALFDIGNALSEENYPYYHILQNAPYIRKRGRATEKSRGSQAKVEKLSERNYNVVSFNGKTYSREYSRNVRGKRNRLNSVSRWVVDASGNKVFINREANSYLNNHYQYIERMMNQIILDKLALEFGLTRRRTQLSGLGEDFALQEHESHESLIEAINSFV